MSSASKHRSAEQLHADIEQTREELGETIETLAAKTDVKAQAKKRIDATKRELSDKAAQVKQTLANKKDGLTERATEGSPDSAGAGVQQVGSKVHERPLPFVAAAAFLFGVIAGAALRRR